MAGWSWDWEPAPESLNEEIHGVTYGKPIGHLREVTAMVRAAIEKGHTGKLGRFEGTYCKADLSSLNTGLASVRESIPIWLPALFQNTVELAAKIARGAARPSGMVTRNYCAECGTGRRTAHCERPPALRLPCEPLELCRGGERSPDGN
jgi:hypothetical protein